MADNNLIVGAVILILISVLIIRFFFKLGAFFMVAGLVVLLLAFAGEDLFTDTDNETKDPENQTGSEIDTSGLIKPDAVSIGYPPKIKHLV